MIVSKVLKPFFLSFFLVINRLYSLVKRIIGRWGCVCVPAVWWDFQDFLAYCSRVYGGLYVVGVVKPRLCLGMVDGNDTYFDELSCCLLLLSLSS